MTLKDEKFTTNIRYDEYDEVLLVEDVKKAVEELKDWNSFRKSQGLELRNEEIDKIFGFEEKQK